ncbi:hypothetical protein HQ602_19795 [Rhodococcus kroppenstedtii]|nr:hypothetical protein [Rhodococcus kroppenstedtii]
MWEISFKTATNNFLIKGQAPTPEDAFEAMIDESDRQLAEAGIVVEDPVSAVINVDMVIIPSRKVVPGPRESRAAVVAELLGVYRQRTRGSDRPAASPVASSIPVDDSDEQLWADIVQVLADNGVKPNGENASGAELLNSWYPDEALREPSAEFWFGRACWRYANLIPGFTTTNPHRSVQISQLWTQLNEDFDTEDTDPPPGWSDAAGQWAARYDRRFVVIADLDGQSLVVDTRDGDARGCVTEYSGGYLDSQDQRWPNLATLLSDLRSTLRGNHRFDGRWTAEMTDGQLRWISAPK